ncbi:MAG: SAM-dependent methyltransferase [Firmicutes bacterium]|nr:SAM-dependent methyltransferase [Bacillota bacterium]
MKINLSPRLSSVASFVLPGKPCADIGTDHGRLPVYLIANDICPKVIAADQTETNILPARELIKLLDMEDRIEIRVGDGLEVLQPKEAATIVLSGMGGNSIKAILKGHESITLTAQRLVLQPQRATHLLRRYLAKSGWQIVDEDIVHDGDFYYEIIAAEKGRMELTEDEAEFGPRLLNGRHPLLKELLCYKKGIIHSIIDALDEDMGGEAQMRKRFLLQESKRIDNIIAQLEE